MVSGQSGFRALVDDGADVELSRLRRSARSLLALAA
jgi:hypothetical protein